MAGAIYRVIDLTENNEDNAVEAELLTELELFDRFAQDSFDRSNPLSSKVVKEWIKAFVTVEALQTVAGVRLEKLDSRQVFNDRLQAHDDTKKSFKKAKDALSDALLSVLSDLTEEDIAEGEVHKSGARMLGAVEYYTSKITPTPVNVILGKRSEERRVGKECPV